MSSVGECQNRFWLGINDPSEVGEILKNMKIVEMKQNRTIERILPRGKEIIETGIPTEPPESPVKVVINYADKLLSIIRRLSELIP
jgi:hypothetical protein